MCLHCLLSVASCGSEFHSSIVLWENEYLCESIRAGIGRICSWWLLLTVRDTRCFVYFWVLKLNQLRWIRYRIFNLAILLRWASKGKFNLLIISVTESVDRYFDKMNLPALWIFSILSIRLFLKESQTTLAYPRVGRTSVKYAVNSVCSGASFKFRLKYQNFFFFFSAEEHMLSMCVFQFISLDIVSPRYLKWFTRLITWFIASYCMVKCSTWLTRFTRLYCILWASSAETLYIRNQTRLHN